MTDLNKIIQKTTEWYAARHEILTGSDVATALDYNDYETSFSLLKRKILPFDQKQPTNQPTNQPNSQTTDQPTDQPTEQKQVSTDWGNHYEPIAKQFFEKITNLQISDVGLQTHKTYEWLGASPDGLVSDGKLIEIKCPISRQIASGKIPHCYWVQVQIQLEVCDVEAAYYIECKFDIIPDHPSQSHSQPNQSNQIPTQYNLQTVTRDRKWFNEILPKLSAFWSKVQHYKIAGLDKLISDSNRKRKNAPIDWSQWICATAVKNHAMKDPLLDWLDLYAGNSTALNVRSPNQSPNQPTEQKQHNQSPIIDIRNPKRRRIMQRATPSNFNQYINNKGLDFEDAVIAYLKSKFNVTTILHHPYQVRDDAKLKETINAMRAGASIIYHAVLRNETNRTYGIPDLLVRSDWLSTLFDESPISNEEAATGCLFSNRWHYRVIDVKYSTLQLRADAVHLLNSGAAPAYKEQLYIYNQALGQLQHYTPGQAYVVGRRQSHTQKGIKYFSNDWFGKAGVIDFNGIDADYEIKTAVSLDWIRDLRANGATWSIDPPNKPELYPNMKNDRDNRWHHVKTQLAEQNKEITSVWMCGMKNRKFASVFNIDRWDDPLCNAATLGINGAKVSPIVDKILHINRHPTKKILPKRLLARLPRYKVEFFVDFETIVDIDTHETTTHETTTHETTTHETTTHETTTHETTTHKSNTIHSPSSTIPNAQLTHKSTIPSTIPTPSSITRSYLYMIGVGWRLKHSNEWQYENFNVANINPHNDSELNLFVEFHDFIIEILDKYRAKRDFIIYHWSNAERHIYNSLAEKYFADVSGYPDLQWYDLLQLFKDEPIVIKGALNFSLKSVAKAMYSHGFIATCWETDGIASGLNAMVKAIECSKQAVETNTDMTDLPIMKKIIEYNEVDCKVMFEILGYLRKHML